VGEWESGRVGWVGSACQFKVGEVTSNRVLTLLGAVRERGNSDGHQPPAIFRSDLAHTYIVHMYLCT
jgi:hypothetical protein